MELVGYTPAETCSWNLKVFSFTCIVSYGTKFWYKHSSSIPHIYALEDVRWGELGGQGSSFPLEVRCCGTSNMWYAIFLKPLFLWWRKDMLIFCQYLFWLITRCSLLIFSGIRADDAMTWNNIQHSNLFTVRRSSINMSDHSILRKYIVCLFIYQDSMTLHSSEYCTESLFA